MAVRFSLRLHWCAVIEACRDDAAKYVAPPADSWSQALRRKLNLFGQHWNAVTGELGTVLLTTQICGYRRHGRRPDAAGHHCGASVTRPTLMTNSLTESYAGSSQLETAPVVAKGGDVRHVTRALIGASTSALYAGEGWPRPASRFSALGRLVWCQPRRSIGRSTRRLHLAGDDTISALLEVPTCPDQNRPAACFWTLQPGRPVLQIVLQLRRALPAVAVEPELCGMAFIAELPRAAEASERFTACRQILMQLHWPLLELLTAAGAATAAGLGTAINERAELSGTAVDMGQMVGVGRGACCATSPLLCQTPASRPPRIGCYNLNSCLSSGSMGVS
jgi:hypothetical protein